MKKITFVIIVLSVMLVGACLVSAHPSERSLPGRHGASVDSICEGSVAHAPDQDHDSDSMISGFHNPFQDVGLNVYV